MQPPTQNVVKKPQHQPSRLRKFVAKNSAGLRIRAHPSLQSEQIGIVLVNDTIAFIDEVRLNLGLMRERSIFHIPSFFFRFTTTTAFGYD